MENLFNMKDFISSVIYSVFGLVMFGVAFYVFDKVTPGDLKDEILGKKNVAAAIVIGAMVLGISIIIGLAIH